MIDGRATRIVRSWVELYTRGLPTDVRDARREEIDSDLWSQLEEARLIGRSGRSTSREIVVRLLAGIPADLSWRAEHRRAAPKRSKSERHAAPGKQAPELLAIIGGLSFGFYTALVLWLGITTPDLRIDDLYGKLGPAVGVLAILLGGGGIILIALATLGLVLAFQERINPVVALAGSIGSAGGLLGAFGNMIVILVWLGSVAVVWNVALIGVVGRRLAVAHALSVGLLLVALGLAVRDAPVGGSFVLAFPYSITLVAIGASINRGVPASESARRG